MKCMKTSYRSLKFFCLSSIVSSSSQNSSQNYEIDAPTMRNTCFIILSFFFDSFFTLFAKSVFCLMSIWFWERRVQQTYSSFPCFSFISTSFFYKDFWGSLFSSFSDYPNSMFSLKGTKDWVFITVYLRLIYLNWDSLSLMKS